MKKSKTNLEYLMSLCDIRGVEIAKALHVDQSLVGKWKNGARTLSPDSGYINDLSQMLAERGREKIDALFSDVYKDEYNPEKFEDFIKAFICSKDPSLMAKTVLHKDLDADYASVYYSYIGREGRKKAMDYLVSCAESVETSVSIYLYDSMCFDWLTEDEEYFHKWGKRIIDLNFRGCDIYLIVDSQRDRERAAELLYNFYPFSANRHFNIYYVNGVNYPTTYIVGGMLAVTGYNDSVEKSFCTQVFTDYSAVCQQELYMRSLLRHRQKDSIKRLTASECFYNVSNLSVISSDMYMFSVIPTLYSMPKELLEKVLAYNTSLDEEKRDKLKEYNRLTSSEFFHKNEKRFSNCIFSLEELKKAALRENVIYSDNLYSEKIYVNSEDFKEHLHFLTEQMRKYENYRVGIVPEFEDFGNEHSKLGYLACKRNCWAIMSNEHSGVKALFFMNSSLVDLIFKAQERLWRSIPQPYTEKENVIKIIEEIAGDN